MTAGGSLRICHLGKYYPPARGGIETHLETLAEGQVRAGHDVEVVCVNHDRGGRDTTWEVLGRTRTREDTPGGVRVARIGRVANVARLDVCPRLWLHLQRSLRRADLVHLHTPNPTMMLALAASPSRTPLVITHHSDVIRQRLLRYALRPLEETLARRAVRILTTSPRYAAGSPLLRAHTAKVRVLTLGIDQTPFRAPTPGALTAQRAFEQEPGPRWLAVGRLVYYKGLSVGLQALRAVPGTLLIVGTGPLEAALRREAEALGVAERVRWLGEVSRDRLVGAYLAATALWFPSSHRSEGFGLVQVEAMASGCPVVNTAIPDSGVPWVAPNEACALTVPPGEPEAFAAAAQRLVEDPDLRARLGAGARARAEAEFGAATMVERSLAHYREVLA